MPPYIYPAPATALLSFSDLCVDPSSSNTVILADATQARSRFRNALKDVEAKNADWLIVLDVGGVVLGFGDGADAVFHFL
jgi:hypothetical protein